ncbi:MAG TPA: heavy metal translocating P-type ATPase [Pirellulales bacterium]|nr:heavy metal translocating P-type ATPase [Pirellulales bacterium]
MNGNSRAEPVSAKQPQARPPRCAAVQTGLCLLFLLTGWLLASPRLATGAYALAYLAGGAASLATAAAALARRRLTVDLLMVVAAAGAAAIGDWAEGGVLLFLFSLSNTLEAYATYRTKRSIESLVRLRPSEATLVRNGQELRVGVETLSIGDLVRIRPGDRVPVDGDVVEGETWVNEATITGESEPVAKGSGAGVFAGTINGGGSVLVRITRPATDTMLERIVRMVHEAQAQKNPTQQFVEAWEQYYVLGVFVGAIIVFCGALLVHTGDDRDALYHAMVLLVVASPCAVVVGSPAVVLSAIARAARHGVLFKGGRYLELLGEVDVVAFDKTGTITFGKPAVGDIWVSNGVQQAEKMLRLAAAVERRSEHHLAVAIVDEAERRSLSLPEVDEFESHTGLGVHGHVEGAWVGVGREALFTSHDLSVPAAAQDAADRLRATGQTVLIAVAPQLDVSGVIGLADQPRPNVAETLRALKRLGIQSNVILTGDHQRAARSVAEAVGADAVLAGLLPEQKVLELRRIMDAGHCLAMVGDGVNDAPALATAHVGIAMGGAGTDVALEVADVVLMRDDLKALPFAIWISRRAKRRIRQNLVFALGVIGVLVLCSFLRLPLWAGVIGHEGSTLLVVLNGLRLLVEKPKP